MSTVSIIIPHYNGKEMLSKCLASLMVQTYKDFTIVVIDNGSTDGSCNALEMDFSEKVSVLTMSHNTGFAYAVNKGIEWALQQKSEYVFVLNNDTIVDSECLERLVTALCEHSDAAISTAKNSQCISPRNN
jgi:GT2 family glycosyltransferase